MQNKKPHYIYDEESVSYVEEKITMGRIFKRIFLYLVGGAVIAVSVMAFLYYGFDTQETADLKDKKSNLEAYTIRAEAENEELRRRVQELETQDQALRERILGVREDQIGVEPVDSSSIASNPENAEKILIDIEGRVQDQESNYQALFEQLIRNQKMLPHLPTSKPVKGEVLAFFGMRIHPALKVPQQHNGIDFEAREGTEVYATGDGKIKFAGAKRRSHQGNIIRIDHGSGLETLYAHLSDFAVKEGQKVKRGELIGYSGRPSNGKGPHLHYEVIRRGKHVDPLDFLLSEYSREEYTDLKKKAQLDGESMD